MKTPQVATTHKTIRIAPLFAAAALCITAPQLKAAPTATKTATKPATTVKAPAPSMVETLGGGTIAEKAKGPAPSFGIGGQNMVLVKNWKFGSNGTIKNIADLNENFMYHDQFGQISNGNGNYGALYVAPDAANAIANQPIEGVNSPPVREFTPDSIKTYLTGLNGATLVDPKAHNAGHGSFVAKWRLPKGGSLLGQDIVWETRVRMKTPKYFWFAIWTAGNKWMWRDGAQGAEVDLVESFGYDNGCGENCTNFDGRYWHSGSVATPSKDAINYDDWNRTMTARGITKFDATQYHTWTWHYKRDNSYTVYVDGIPVQSGSDYHWTYGNRAQDEVVDMSFLFDGSWGHTQIGSVNKTLPTSEFADKFYEWNYSRVYLSDPAIKVAAAPFKSAHKLPGTIQAEDFDRGGQTVSSYYLPNPNANSAYRPDELVGLVAAKDAGGGFALTSASVGQYVKYTVNVAKAGLYAASFRVTSDVDGASFHLENARGTNISGGIVVPNTKSAQTWTTVNGTVTLAAGPQTITLVQDASGFNVNWMSVGKTLSVGPLAEGEYRLLNRGNNADSLDVGAQRTENNSGVGLYKYVAGKNQQWILHNLGDGKYQIIGVQSGRALGVKGDSKEAGSAVVISDYLGLPSQQWTLVASGTGFKIKNVGSGRVLEAPAQITDDADKLTQLWDISPA